MVWHFCIFTVLWNKIGEDTVLYIVFLITFWWWFDNCTEPFELCSKYVLSRIIWGDSVFFHLLISPIWHSFKNVGIASWRIPSEYLLVVWSHLQVVFWRPYPKIIGVESDGKNKAKQEFGEKKQKHSWKDVNNLKTVMKWNIH